MARAAKKAKKASAKKPAKTPARAKGKGKATKASAKSKPIKAKSRAKQSPRTKATPRVETSVPMAPADSGEIERAAESSSDAIPQMIAFESSSESGRRSLSARERMLRSSPVVEILDDAYPIGALRRFLDSIKGLATPQQAQIALGAGQLTLQPIARENRGGSEVKEIVDLELA